MSKTQFKPSTMLYPVPVVMVSCRGSSGRSNIITLAWAGTVNSEPPMLSVSIRKERFSHGLIKETGEFAVNLVSRKLAAAADFCGVKSGRDTDKFSVMKLHEELASVISIPLIKESPLSLECRVKNIMELGSHDLFIAEIVAVDVEKELIDEKDKIDIVHADLICFSHGQYWPLGKTIGKFGFSVAKHVR